MNESKILTFLKSELNFSEESIKKIQSYCQLLLEANKRYNLIGKSTEKYIWKRHVLDSAQLVKLIDFSDNKSLSDLGSGAGFPGIIIAIYNQNPKFHVKLYDKSIVKCNFLRNIVKKLHINNVNIFEGNYQAHKINSKYITARAFKKIDEILYISREIAQKPHKFIVLKGKSAQEDIENSSKGKNLKYKLVDSITDEDSKIIIIDA